MNWRWLSYIQQYVCVRCFRVSLCAYTRTFRLYRPRRDDAHNHNYKSSIISKATFDPIFHTNHIQDVPHRRTRRICGLVHITIHSHPSLLSHKAPTTTHSLLFYVVHVHEYTLYHKYIIKTYLYACTKHAPTTKTPNYPKHTENAWNRTTTSPSKPFSWTIFWRTRSSMCSQFKSMCSRVVVVLQQFLDPLGTREQRRVIAAICST